MATAKKEEEEGYLGAARYMLMASSVFIFFSLATTVSKSELKKKLCIGILSCIEIIYV